MSENEKSLRLEQQEAAAKLKRQQEKVRNRFDFLKNVPTRHFQAEYVKAQAEEIISYVGGYRCEGIVSRNGKVLYPKPKRI